MGWDGKNHTQDDSGGKVSLWEVIVSVIVRKKIMYVCLILNGY